MYLRDPAADVLQAKTRRMLELCSLEGRAPRLRSELRRGKPRARRSIGTFSAAWW